MSALADVSPTGEYLSTLGPKYPRKCWGKSFSKGLSLSPGGNIQTRGGLSPNNGISWGKTF